MPSESSRTVCVRSLGAVTVPEDLVGVADIVVSNPIDATASLG
jgi:hypothetical protein